jgi:hypothetical protein
MAANQFLKAQLFQSEQESEEEERAKAAEKLKESMGSFAQVKKVLPKTKKTLKKERLNK